MVSESVIKRTAVYTRKNRENQQLVPVDIDRREQSCAAHYEQVVNKT